MFWQKSKGITIVRILGFSSGVAVPLAPWAQPSFHRDDRDPSLRSRFQKKQPPARLLQILIVLRKAKPNQILTVATVEKDAAGHTADSGFANQTHRFPFTLPAGHIPAIS